MFRLRKCEGMLIVFQTFSNEKRLKIALYWAINFPSHFVHIPECARRDSNPRPPVSETDTLSS